jgi:hypothetical protein
MYHVCSEGANAEAPADLERPDDGRDCEINHSAQIAPSPHLPAQLYDREIDDKQF